MRILLTIAVCMVGAYMGINVLTEPIMCWWAGVITLAIGVVINK